MPRAPHETRGGKCHSLFVHASACFGSASSAALYFSTAFGKSPSCKCAFPWRKSVFASAILAVHQPDKWEVGTATARVSKSADASGRRARLGVSERNNNHNQTHPKQKFAARPPHDSTFSHRLNQNIFIPIRAKRVLTQECPVKEVRVPQICAKTSTHVQFALFGVTLMSLSWNRASWEGGGCSWQQLLPPRCCSRGSRKRSSGKQEEASSLRQLWDCVATSALLVQAGAPSTPLPLAMQYFFSKPPSRLHLLLTSGISFSLSLYQTPLLNISFPFLYFL